MGRVRGRKDLSHWGRSTTDLLSTLEELEARRVPLAAVNGIAFDLTTPRGCVGMMATLLADIAEFERELTQEPAAASSLRRSIARR